MGDGERDESLADDDSFVRWLVSDMLRALRLLFARESGKERGSSRASE